MAYKFVEGIILRVNEHWGWNSQWLGFTVLVNKSFVSTFACLKQVEISRTMKSIFCSCCLQESTNLHKPNSNRIQKSHLDLIAVLLYEKQRVRISLSIAVYESFPSGSLLWFSWQAGVPCTPTAAPTPLCPLPHVILESPVSVSSFTLIWKTFKNGGFVLFIFVAFCWEDILYMIGLQYVCTEIQ